MIGGFDRDPVQSGASVLAAVERLLEFIAGLLGVTGRLLRMPVEAVLAIVTWFVYKVCGDVSSLPMVLVLGVHDAVARVRIRLELRRVELRIRAEQRIAVQSQVALFLQVLDAAERLDRELSEFDPRFAETLTAAQAAYQVQVAALARLPTDRRLRARTDEILAGREGEDVAR